MKEYNRLYGMQRGDLCLKKIGETITACFPGALVGHLTTDHFAALLPSADLEAKLECVCREVNSYINDDGIQLKAGIYRPTEEDTLGMICGMDLMRSRLTWAFSDISISAQTDYHFGRDDGQNAWHPDAGRRSGDRGAGTLSARDRMRHDAGILLFRAEYPGIPAA